MIYTTNLKTQILSKHSPYNTDRNQPNLGSTHNLLPMAHQIVENSHYI